MTQEQKRLKIVLERILKLNEEDPDFSVDFNNFLEDDLETLAAWKNPLISIHHEVFSFNLNDGFKLWTGCAPKNG